MVASFSKMATLYHQVKVRGQEQKIKAISLLARTELLHV